MRNFHEWLEKFGFDAEKQIISVKNDGLPIKLIDVDLITEYLKKSMVGQRLPKKNFVNEVCWGDGPGAIKAYITSNKDVIISKLHKDKLGHDAWICKEVVLIDDVTAASHHQESAIANKILKHVTNLNSQPLDGFNENYNKDQFEDLVIDLASQIKFKMSRIYLREVVTPGDNHYIIILTPPANGNKALDQVKCEQIQCEFKYDNSTGLIHHITREIHSKIGRERSYTINFSNLEAYFVPTQSKDSINKCVVNYLLDNYEKSSVR